MTTGSKTDAATEEKTKGWMRERGREKDGVGGLERQQELYHMAQSNLSLWHHGWWEGRPHHPIVSSYFIMGFVSVNCNKRKTGQARWTRQLAHFSPLVLPPVYNVCFHGLHCDLVKENMHLFGGGRYTFHRCAVKMVYCFTRSHDTQEPSHGGMLERKFVLT